MTGPSSLEPYAVRLRAPVSPGDPEAFARTLLEELAERAEHAGATLIGHLKCRVEGPSGTLYCNLTSRRSGAACRTVGAPPRPGPDSLEVDLAVLVYGLNHATVAGLVEAALTVRRGEGLDIRVHRPSGDGEAG